MPPLCGFIVDGDWLYSQSRDCVRQLCILVGSWLFGGFVAVWWVRGCLVGGHVFLNE